MLSVNRPSEPVPVERATPTAPFARIVRSSELGSTRLWPFTDDAGGLESSRRCLRRLVALLATTSDKGEREKHGQKKFHWDPSTTVPLSNAGFDSAPPPVSVVPRKANSRRPSAAAGEIVTPAHGGRAREIAERHTLKRTGAVHRHAQRVAVVIGEAIRRAALLIEVEACPRIRQKCWCARPLAHEQHLTCAGR